MRAKHLGRPALIASLGVLAAGSARADVLVGLGGSVPLMTMSSIDEACRSEGPVAVTVLVPPRGGAVEIAQIAAHPHFTAQNARARCNALMLPATQVTYRSNGSYLGADVVLVQVTFPRGAVRRVRVPIFVRPAVPPPPPPATPAPVPPGDPKPSRQAPNGCKGACTPI